MDAAQIAVLALAMSCGDGSSPMEDQSGDRGPGMRLPPQIGDGKQQPANADAAQQQAPGTDGSSPALDGSAMMAPDGGAAVPFADAQLETHFEAGPPPADAEQAKPDAGRSAADAAAQRDASAGQCAMPGTGCTATACCVGTTCVNDHTAGLTVCAVQCTRPDQCMSGCCAAVTGSNVGACGPASLCSVPAPPSGCNLIAADEKFIGKATSNQFDTEGVCNEFGNYGSEFATNSIYNQFGTYGSEFNSLSAYNRFTSMPPAIICDNNVRRGYVTKNTTLTGAIDPDVLCATLRANGL